MCSAAPLALAELDRHTGRRISRTVIPLDQNRSCETPSLLNKLDSGVHRLAGCHQNAIRFTLPLPDAIRL
jgi:hypothetical protein